MLHLALTFGAASDAPTAVEQGVSDDTRLVVSEPFGDLPGIWNEVPESSYGAVHKGHDGLHALQPQAP